MSTNALVYLNPGLPIRIENADRLVYLPDGSQHVLDKNDRPLFTAPPKTGVCIVMEYAQTDEPTEAQVARFAREEHAERIAKQHRQERAAEMTQPIQKVAPEMVNVNRETGTVAPVPPVRPVVPLTLQQRQQFPDVKEFGPRLVTPPPGMVSVTPSEDVPSDVTGEMVVPDFREAPTGAIPESGESSSQQSPKHEETDKTSEPGAAAS